MIITKIEFEVKYIKPSEQGIISSIPTTAQLDLSMEGDNEFIEKANKAITEALHQLNNTNQ